MGFIVGSGVVGASTFDLTALGPTDWAHWSDALTGVPNQIKSGGGTIGNLTLINVSTHAQISQFTDGRTFSWTNGNPTGTGSDTLGVFVANTGGAATGNGLSITIPATTSPQQIILVTGGFQATQNVSATLSDGSATPYSDSTFSSASSGFQDVYTINYAANSGGQTLTVAITVATDFGAGLGNITLCAAMLAPGSSSSVATIAWVT